MLVQNNPHKQFTPSQSLNVGKKTRISIKMVLLVLLTRNHFFGYQKVIKNQKRYQIKCQQTFKEKKVEDTMRIRNTQKKENILTQERKKHKSPV